MASWKVGQIFKDFQTADLTLGLIIAAIVQRLVTNLITVIVYFAKFETPSPPMNYQESAWDPSAMLSTSFTLDDLSKASQNFQPSNSTYQTFVLKLIGDAQDKGYKRVCMPLTTEKWKKRWSEMCLLPSERSDQDKESAARAAESWRLNPAFQRDEVTITRIGVSVKILCSFTQG